MEQKKQGSLFNLSIPVIDEAEDLFGIETFGRLLSMESSLIIASGDIV